MSNYCRKKDCARKKKVVRPCLESLRIPTPCVHQNPINHPLCHYRNYNNSSPEMCNSLDFRPTPDIYPFNNRYVEENRRESFARANNYEYDEAADLGDDERNPNIQDQPTRMRSENYNRNNNNFEKRDDVHHVGTLAAPKTCCKGNQNPIIFPESDCNRGSNPTPDNEDKEVQTNEDINRSYYRSHANQTNPNIPSQSGLYISSIADNRSTDFMTPPRYSGPSDTYTRPTCNPSKEIQDGSSQSYINSNHSYAHDNVAPENISYLQNSPGTAQSRQTCCKKSGLTDPDIYLPRFNSKYQALQNSLNSSRTPRRQERCCSGTSSQITSRIQEGCCSQKKDRLFKRKKSMRSVICACPDEYELYSREIKCSRKINEREMDLTSTSVSCATNQAGHSCRCRYPPLFKQFSCAGNIHGTCNCIDNF